MKKIECVCPLRHQHGTMRMYTTHRCRCVRCRSANAAKAAAYRNRTPHPASDRWIDPTGSIRRLRALAAIGVPRDVIAEHLGVTTRHVQALRDGVHPRLRRDTAERITAVYEQLWDAPAALRSDNTRRQAAMRGYHVPLAWDEDEIDDPNAEPHTPGNGGWDLAPCGTPAAYRRHFRKGEAPCIACTEANRVRRGNGKKVA